KNNHSLKWKSLRIDLKFFSQQNKVMNPVGWIEIDYEIKSRGQSEGQSSDCRLEDVRGISFNGSVLLLRQKHQNHWPKQCCPPALEQHRKSRQSSGLSSKHT
ncbi:MAG: hypothetical protein KQI35_19210, partial [Bacteroidetes bacterium]|nr:hypothetical protein [Bacteroidota bacterium]